MDKCSIYRTCYLIHSLVDGLGLHNLLYVLYICGHALNGDRIERFTCWSKEIEIREDLYYYY